MDLRKLKKLIDLVEESGIAELEITEGEEKVRIVKHPNVGQPASGPVARRKRSTLDDDDADDEAERDDPPSGKAIKSPIVGTFYRSETPSAAPYIEVGSAVKAGDTLCGIEAMKQFNEVKADCDGTVKAILVENGQAVGFGQPLIVIG